MCGQFKRSDGNSSSCSIILFHKKKRNDRKILPESAAPFLMDQQLVHEHVGM
jgi:hypothetical protein